MIQSEGGWLGQLGVALQDLDWNGNDLEVKIAGTLKNDKFIVIKPIKPVVSSVADPTLKQKNNYDQEFTSEIEVGSSDSTTEGRIENSDSSADA